MDQNNKQKNNTKKPFLQTFRIMYIFYCVALFYLPFAHSNSKDSDISKECLRAFSIQTIESEIQTTESEESINSLLNQIKDASRKQTTEILEGESPANLKLLIKELFSGRGKIKEKHKLLYTLRDNPPEDPDIQWVLARALLLEEGSVKREVIQIVGKINKYIKPEVLSEIIKILMRALRFGESGGIKQDAASALGKIKPKDPDIHSKLKNMISLEEDDWTKQALIRALGEMSPTDPSIHQFLAKMLSERKEFETKKDVRTKREVAKAIGKMNNIQDSKTLELLVESLDSLNDDIRQDIYSSLKTALQYISVKTGQRLAGRMGRKDHSFEEDKLRIIEIVKQIKPKDTLTIQWLAKGLNDLSSSVRKSTVEALGDILEERPNPLKTVYDEGIYPLFVHPVKSWALWSPYDFTKSIRFSIIDELQVVALFDPDPSVRKAALEATVQVNTCFAAGVDTLIEAFSSDSDSDVKIAANEGLIETFDRGLLNWAFHLTGLLPSKGFGIRKKSEIIKQLANHLYNKDPELRRVAHRALDKITKPKKYYSVQKKKADDLNNKMTKYENKNIQIVYDNPNSEPPNKVPLPFESWFEVEIFLEIHKRGFIVLPQVMAYDNVETPDKNYRIDLLVLDANDSKKKLAVECDGPYHEDPTRKISDLERQITLGEQGLVVRRIKYSDFYSFPLDLNSDYNNRWRNRKKRTEFLDSFWRKLKEMGIKPVQSAKTGYFQ